MQEQTFRDQLKAEGFAELMMVEREPNGALAQHRHPFEAKALVLGGELTLRTEAGEQRYQRGDVFHLAPNQPHSEVFGAQGVRYLVGRKPVIL